MTDDLEKRMREKAEALLVARNSETAAARPKTAKEKAKAARTKARALRTIKRRRAERRRQNRVRGIDDRTKNQGVDLGERLLARTEPNVWYYFRQLRALLPETTTAGVKAIVYQKLRDLGWIERRALIDRPGEPWLGCEGDPTEKADGEMYAGTIAAIRPRYVYRIGAEQAKKRARTRERLSAVTGERFGGERASAGEYGGFSDL